MSDSFFLCSTFPTCPCTFVLVHTSFAFSVRRPPTFTTCPMRSVSRVSLLLACRECNCCPTNRHHAYIVLSASWSSHTHTPFLFCCFVASQLVSLSSFAITSAPLLPFLPPTSCTHRRWFAPKDKMTTKTMKTTRECRRWTKMRCIHHSTRGRSARVLLFVLSVSLSRITPARAPSPCPATTAINRHHRHHSLHRL